MTPLEDIRAHALLKLGKLDGGSPYPEATLAWMQGRVPASMIDMLKTLGLGTYAKGKWQTVDAKLYDGLLSQTLHNDPDFSASSCTAFAIHGFGDLACWHLRYGVFSLNVLPNELLSPYYLEPAPMDVDRMAMAAFSTTHLSGGTYYDKFDAASQGMFDRLVAAHGPLQQGQIFAPKLHPAIGGRLAVDNFRPVSAPEATALLHQMEPFFLMDRRKPKGIRLRSIGRQ